MMSSHDNPPRRGTRSWSTPDPVSRGRRYSHHSRRKNEKDGGFNTKNKSVSPFLLERETRETRDERKRKERRIGTIQLHSLITRERIFSCNRAYNRQSHHIFDTNTTITKKKKRKEKKRTPPPPPHLARAVHHSEGQSRHLFLVGGGGLLCLFVKRVFFVFFSHKKKFPKFFALLPFYE